MWRLAIATLLLGVARLNGIPVWPRLPRSQFHNCASGTWSRRGLVSATGTLEAQTTVYISSQLSGQIAEVYVDFNDVVKAGQPLARLDQESFLAHVNQARADLTMATATVNLQQATVERAKLRVITARSEQRLAEDRLPRRRQAKGSGKGSRAKSQTGSYRKRV